MDGWHGIIKKKAPRLGRDPAILQYMMCMPLRTRGFFCKIAAMALVGILLCSSRTFAEMSSTNYVVEWDAFSVGGTDTASSSSYRLRSSFDFGVAAGSMESSSYALDGGYRGGVYDRTVAFTLFVQDRSSQVGASAATLTTVTVTSTADYAVGDMIFLVQDEGAAQVGAMGKITALTSSLITVDAFTGGSPSIDGAGDYVYLATEDGTSLPLTTPTPATVTTGMIGWDVSADIASGYDVYVFEDDELHAGGSVVADVGDGTVTAGVGEYGGRSSDTSLASSTFDTQDTALSTALQQVASRSGASFSTRDFLTLKLAVSATQAGGNYGHNVSVIFAGTY